MLPNLPQRDTKVDLHCHSKYSDYPSTWGHKVYNSPESFTEVETLYRQAKDRGMDFVTITDHDDIRGCLELMQLHPDDSFVSCEITTFFPEDNCKIHILVYDISEAQFQEIMRIASSIYTLRDYLRNEDIAHSVAHATYDQDGKLQFEHIEKLVLLFDVFEIINGGSDAQNNLMLHQYLLNLDQAKLNQLRSKHNIDPYSSEPWIKGYTGGSDDHCGILVGSAYTQCTGRSKEDFLNSLRNKQSLGNGMHGSFEIYATGVFKHVHDYRRSRDDKYGATKMSDFLDLFFSGNEGSLLKRFKKSQSLRYLKKKNSKTHKALHKLLKQINRDKDRDISAKIPIAYQKIIGLHDEMFKSIVTAATVSLPRGDIFKGISKLTTLFPMTLLVLPFIGSMRHQALKYQIKSRLIQETGINHTAKALWVTDTIDDLNGVSVTLRQISKQSEAHGYYMKLLTCVDEELISEALPNNAVNIAPVAQVEVPGYETLSLGFPSILRMMQLIDEEKPDQIIISTPGPLGLGALLCARLMNLPVSTIYHTDFAEQVMRISEEASLARLTENLVNMFYKQSDQVFVPSNFYIEKLKQAGLDSAKLNIFPRGINLNIYKPAAAANLPDDYRLQGDFTLLFAGRISKDKNLVRLVEVINLAQASHKQQFNFVIAGDGPDFIDLEQQLAGIPNVLLTGRLSTKELIEWYRNSDLLFFPSHTDTFGMVVLEAQACGLPCLVTNTGGPKEIIIPGRTGQVIINDQAENWLNEIINYRKLKQTNAAVWNAVRDCCVTHVRNNNNWGSVFKSVLGTEYKFQNNQPMATHSDIANLELVGVNTDQAA